MTPQLDVERPCSASLWLNGEPVQGNELRLTPGENRLVVRLTQTCHPGQVTLTPDGACYRIELTQWRYWPDGPLEV